MTLQSWTSLPHRDPSCTAGFTAVLEAPSVFSSDGRPTTVEVRCWSCSTRWSFTSLTPFTNDPSDDEHGRTARPDAQHTPYLAESFSTLDGLPASQPVVKAGPALLHPAVMCGYGDGVYLYDVSDRDGNILGQVGMELTPRGATRWAWGTPDTNQAAGHGSGCTTPQQAAKQLAAACGVTR